MHLLLWRRFRDQCKVEPKGLQGSRGQTRKKSWPCSPPSSVTAGWLMSVTLHSGRCHRTSALYPGSVVWEPISVSCLCVRQTRKRQSESDAEAKGNITCLIADGADQFQRSLWCVGHRRSGTDRHTCEQTDPCTLVIHPAPFMLVLWEVRCTQRQEENREQSKTEMMWRRQRKRTRERECSHNIRSGCRNYGFFAGLYTTERLAGYCFHYGNYVNSYVNKYAKPRAMLKKVTPSTKTWQMRHHCISFPSLYLPSPFPYT